MKLRLPRALAALVAAAGLALSAAPSLADGELFDAAPPLQVQHWVKGEPVSMSDDKIYVVEFWATWCGPCLQSIPHLSEMQKKYGDKVTFIGISDEPLETVRPFVEKMGEKMAYTVATSEDRKPFMDYMKAYGQGGIPHAFVVQNGKVVWHAHPMDNLEAVLDKVVAGEWDEATVKKMDEEKKAQQSRQLQVREKANAYLMMADGRTEADDATRQAAGQELFELIKDQPATLNQLAWLILTEQRITKRDIPLATQMAEAAVAKTERKDAAILDTLARAYWDGGQKAKAVEVQRAAVKVAEADAANQPDGMLDELKATLEGYEREAKAAA